MQRSLSRVVPTVYITVYFSDEVLDSAETTFAVEVTGGILDRVKTFEVCLRSEVRS